MRAVPVSWRLLHGDCLEQMRTLAAESVDALVSDPPYGIGFMGKEWDTFKPDVASKKQGLRQINKSESYSRQQKRLINPNLKGRTVDGAISSSQIEYDYTAAGLRRFQVWTEAWAREAFRVLKPGSHAVVCGAPRAYHRMASGLEDAGFEIRDCLAWLFGSGFPKSLNLGEGLGTALKPAHEPIVLARKPFKGSVKGNVETHGTGALNIDACRIGTLNANVDESDQGVRGRASGNGARATTTSAEMYSLRAGNGPIQHAVVQNPSCRATRGSQTETGREETAQIDSIGRWPANVCLDEIAALVLDEQSGELTSGGYPPEGGQRTRNAVYGDPSVRGEARFGASEGGASRFYYVAKPSREERDMGCGSLPARTAGECTERTEGSAGLNNPRAGAGRTGGGRNFHPTVKPVELMRWLIRLVTPINGLVLDPFMGSGTTGMAARYELRSFIGIEREAEYIEIAQRRISAVAPLFGSGGSAA